jgi:hypothetical protein
MRKRTLLALVVLAVTLVGCVVVPGRPVYYHPVGVVVY